MDEIMWFIALLESINNEESSESSSDSGEEIMRESMNYLQGKIECSKVNDYIETVNNYNDEQFRRNFRVSKPMYEKIKDMYEKSDFRSKNEHGLPCTSTETQVLLFLWFTGNKCVIRDVASRFNIAESTCHKTCNIMIDFLFDISPTVIKFPRSEDEKRTIATEFEKIGGFPGIIGAVDGTYIPIRIPAHKIRSTYVNRHGQTSITLQGICDVKKKFLDVFTGTPSKMHDSRIFKMSFISQELPAICGDDWHLIGDSAYPVQKWLLTPYEDYGNLSREEKHFNFKLSQCRVKIENAFCLLKGRFRQLQRTKFLSVEKVCKFVIACCVLHNLCIINADEWDGEELEHENNDEEDHGLPHNNVTNNVKKRDGERKRNEMCAELFQNNR